MQSATSASTMRATSGRRKTIRPRAEAPNFAVDAAPYRDAEPAEAAKHFEPLLREYLALRRDWVRLGKAAREKADKKFAGNMGRGLPGQAPKWQYFEKIGRQNGYEKACHQLSELYDKMEPLAESIRNFRAVSIEELRALAMVAIWDTLPWQATSSDLSFDRADTYGALLDSAIAMAGLSELAGLAAASMPSRS
jgi:hypothetical protein